MRKACSSLYVRFALQHTHVFLSRPGSVLGGGCLSLQQLGLSTLFKVKYELLFDSIVPVSVVDEAFC